MRIEYPVRLPSSLSRFPFSTSLLTAQVSFLLLSILLAGCGTSTDVFTHDMRKGRSIKDLQELQFFVSADVELVSTQKGELIGEPPFRTEVKKRYSVPKDQPGKIVSADETWLIIDFGQGVLLTFRLADTGSYVMPSWGTISLGGERFDVQMGVLAGTPIVLRYEIAPANTK